MNSTLFELHTTSSICGILACTVAISLEAIGFKFEHTRL